MECGLLSFFYFALIKMEVNITMRFQNEDKDKEGDEERNDTLETYVWT